MVVGLAPVLVSACLLGEKCRYDGQNSCCPLLLEKLRGRPVIAACPEQLGGLGTPRKPAEIIGGDGKAGWEGKALVKAACGQELTENFRQGAEKTWRLLLEKGCTAAILKERSPSCGKNFIYDGAFQKRLRPGPGVTTALLLEKGIPVYSETEWISGEGEQNCREKK
ncbi:MAG: DUF523 domain-containing protein [Firmicutes bacterium]|nr:DUF523 domain-containing protein [Bacillota bacterium]